jgi:capsular polysaccharide transport system permease protein
MDATQTDAGLRPRSRPAHWHTRDTPLARTGRAVWAVALRELRAAYASRRLGLFWAFAEPVAYVVTFTLLMTAMKQNHSPLGEHVAPFLALGVMNYMLFNSVEKYVRGAIRANRGLLSFPRVKPIDLFVGRWVTEAATLLVVFFVLMTFFVLMGMIGPPAQLERMFLPICFALLLGFGTGIINFVIIMNWKAWDSIYSVVSRFHFFTSGVFFLAAGMPTGIRKILYYQPLLHLSEWLRSAYYPNFESQFYDPEYVAAYVLAVITLALVLERATRKKVLSG